MCYEALFKCRLCGETFIEGIAEDIDMARKGAILASIGKSSSDPTLPCLHSVHICKNLDVGIADFLGFRGGAEGE